MTGRERLEPMHQIHYSFRERNLLGQGVGPSATSLPRSGEAYQQLTRWDGHLAGVVVPEFASGQEGPGHWYRWFDGQGVLVYRAPEAVRRDRRGGTARALVGPALTPELALVAAHRGAVAKRREAAPGWATLEPIPAPSREEFDHGVRALEEGLMGDARLVDLVREVLAARREPVDVLVPDTVGQLTEEHRILLLWGVRRALTEVFDQVHGVRPARERWSFATYDPWPADTRFTSERPMVAFRPRPRGADLPRGRRPLDLFSPSAVQDRYRDVAQWLVNRDRDRPLGDLAASDYEELMDRLHERADQDGWAFSGIRKPKKPDTAPVRDPEPEPGPTSRGRIETPPGPEPEPEPEPEPAPPRRREDPVEGLLHDLAAAATPDEVETAANGLVAHLSPAFHRLRAERTAAAAGDTGESGATGKVGTAEEGRTRRSRWVELNNTTVAFLAGAGTAACLLLFSLVLSMAVALVVVT
ncbi:hypothetical protein [Nocardiopsis oceani]